MSAARRPLLAGSQCERLLAYFSRGHSLTVVQALRQFGIYALSQRCTELRSRGHDVRATMIEHKGKRIAKYTLYVGRG